MTLEQGHLLGVDVGTSGVRIMATDVRGRLSAESFEPLDPDFRTDKIHEQDPQDWWKAVCLCMRRVTSKLRGAFTKTEYIGVAVTSTSGTLVLADKNGEPVRAAILYDDSRGGTVCDEINQAEGCAQTVHPSFSIVKAAWVARSEPEVWEQTRYVTHPTGWLTGRLTGEFGTSDWSNALKLGFDVQRKVWSRTVHTAGVPTSRLPTVCRPGTRVGSITRLAAQETGLPEGVAVLAGTTDGIASFLASGAAQLGHCNTTLGTTIVWKILAKEKPAADERIYCHLHPSGQWIPGAASNTGMGSLQRESDSITDSDFDRLASPCLPIRMACYLLRGRGERFPFTKPDAVAFCEGKPQSNGEWYAAQLQSIAFVERWGYELLIEAGIPVGDVVLSAGGAASSPVLSQLRADVLDRSVVRTQHPVAAFGAAVLAGCDACYSGDIYDAIASMTSRDEEYLPRPDLRSEFDSIYLSFRELCARKGYA